MPKKQIIKQKKTNQEKNFGKSKEKQSENNMLST